MGHAFEAFKAAILENKLHTLRLTAARCLKERPHKAPLPLTTSTTLSFVCSRKEKQLFRDYTRIENLKRYIEFILVRRKLNFR